ncbi:MFS general substrate transporter [Suhomyces tanzawaensis NRRL Y-17324]|uniref:MFS general substrate transporter n=1 Tax=Suhomyces tanzawaensis NRRL Y-17324 TaxID=984487 RepID=A0A1E4SKL5_9ASCO|nr:MFS general substrate transporter [Suhomyces tanzawaensis NRRL Y-17324]ODV79977.1 MFS general substrate transporter [Suhomyces tanzawaensis NRRL Y-17324]
MVDPFDSSKFKDFEASVDFQTASSSLAATSSFSKLPYSILSSREKYFMVALLSASGIWSTLATSIYFPALPVIAEKFHVSTEAVNLSVVAYLLFQGVCPTLLASVSDHYGRRPCVIGCLVSYSGVCVAISRCNAYWLLAFLRCLQAGTIASLISVSSGVIGDMSIISHRGKFVGLVSGIQLLGQGFGALLGAGIVTHWGWRGIFVFLAIGSGFVGIIAFLMLPETNRSLVGNMSIIPTNFWNKLPILSLSYFSSRLLDDKETKEPVTPIRLFGSWKIIAEKEVFFALLPGSFQFATWTMSLTTLSTNLQADYNYSTMHVGACYLAPGLGTLVGAVLTGRIIDWVYKRRKAQYDYKYTHLSESERPEFDLLRARLDFAAIPTILLIIFSVVFGWCLDKKLSVVPILISLFFISCCAVSFMSASTTLLIDMYPGQGSAATSCMNLLRCWIGAIGVGVLQKMVNKMGEGGTYTLMAGLCLMSGLSLVFVVKKRN